MASPHSRQSITVLEPTPARFLIPQDLWTAKQQQQRNLMLIILDPYVMSRLTSSDPSKLLSRTGMYRLLEESNDELLMFRMWPHLPRDVQDQPPHRVTSFVFLLYFYFSLFIS